MKIIVVGAEGYIGSKLMAFPSNHSDVVGTSRGGDENVRLDLNCPQEFDYSLIAKGDAVLLTGGVSSPEVCATEYSRARATNVTGTMSFVSKAISLGARVIFFSSDTVYGEREDEVDEATSCNPAGPYAKMKHEIEHCFFGNPCFKTIRLSYVFSIEDQFTKYLRGCVDKDVEAEVFHPFNRAVVCRKDVVKGAIALANRWNEFPQQIINFGGPYVIARNEFAQILKDSVLPTLRFRVVEPAPVFFESRPRIIQMRSLVLPELLKRPARSLGEAAELEFRRKGEEQNV